MTRDEVVAILKSITYKPGYELKVEAIFGGIVRLGIAANLPDSENPTGPHIVIKAEYSWEPCDIFKKEHLLYDVETFLHNFERHEMFEWLRVDGKRVHDPHKEQ